MFVFTQNLYGGLPIAMNIQQVNYWPSSYPVFTDLAKSIGEWRWSSRWGMKNRKGALINYDTNGYPIGVPQKINDEDSYPVGIFNNNVSGNYLLTFDGNGKIDLKSNNKKTIKITARKPNKIYFTILHSPLY